MDGPARWQRNIYTEEEMRLLLKSGGNCALGRYGGLSFMKVVTRW